MQLYAQFGGTAIALVLVHLIRAGVSEFVGIDAPSSWIYLALGLGVVVAVLIIVCLLRAGLRSSWEAE